MTAPASPAPVTSPVTKPAPLTSNTGLKSSAWIRIYPVYLNSKKTVSEGRKIAKNQAAENPTATEIADVCKFLGLECEVEPEKAYSRDPLSHGRIKVRFRNELGQPILADLKTKRQLLGRLGTLIPKLASRASGGSGGSAHQSTGAGTSRKKNKKNK